jgi:tetratricopeptide (TPR) repeat protein
MYQEVLRLDGGDARVRVDLCQLYARLNDYPLAEEQARRAVETFRTSGNRGGEAQALLCAGEAQRVQGGTRVAEARQNIEAARAIFESLGYEYGLSRVHQYLGLVASAERNYTAAAAHFEEALARSRAVGNRPIEGVAFTNLGVVFDLLGDRASVLKYYEEARDFFQRAGDEQRAAEQEFNAATLLIDYGGDQDAALRRIINARAMFQKLGNIEFHVGAMEMEAVSALHAGRHDEARRQLRAALSLARERQLGPRVVYASIRLADSFFEMAEYEQARVLLEETSATPAGRDELALPIALGRIYARLGDADGARRRLEAALEAVEASGQRRLAPLAHLALGELDYGLGRIDEARAHFDRAAAEWVDQLPDAASVEAACYGAALDPQRPAAAAKVAAGVDQARRMRRLYSEAQCRVQQARVHLARREPGDALGTLDRIPLDGELAVGPELRASAHYWRSRALAALGDRSAAEAEASRARRAIADLRESLPAPYRDRFAARSDLRHAMAN